MERVILYGFGNVGKNMFAYLKSKYFILAWVDSNSTLWENEYEGIVISSPNVLNGYCGKVIVTTTDKFFIEISNNLLEIGLKKEQIFRGQHCIYNQDFEVVPYEYSMLKLNNQKPLYMYDMLEKVDNEDGLNIMVFGSFYTVYLDALVKNIKIRYPNLNISILTNSEKHCETVGVYASHVYVFHSYVELKSILELLPVYDVFQLLWIENIWVYFKDIIRKKCKKLNLCVGGSDLFRAREPEVIYKNELVKIADNVSAETEDTIDYFYKKYPNVELKLKWVNFGLEAIDVINLKEKDVVTITKEKYCIPLEKIVVVCGHNGNSAHNHLKIIRALDSMKPEYKNAIVAVFPMTYNVESQEYVESVSMEMKATNISYVILNDFMNLEEIAAFDMIVDVMLHVQNTDQLSSTMLEQMYTGAIVIAGKWLPYEMLERKGVYFLSVESIEDITLKMENIICNFEEYQAKCIDNKKAIYEMSSWDAVSSRWLELWN